MRTRTKLMVPLAVAIIALFVLFAPVVPGQYPQTYSCPQGIFCFINFAPLHLYGSISYALFGFGGALLSTSWQYVIYS